MYPAASGSTDPSPGEYTYPEGTQVSITAIENDDWDLGEWQGDASGTDDTVTVIVDADKTVTAVFEESGGATNWPLISGAIVAGLAAIGTFFFLLIIRRRKKQVES